MIPIWKDYTINIGPYASVLFRIRTDSATGAIIYEGRAYRRPGASQAAVKVNDICAGYLAGSGKPGTGSPTRTFVLQANTGTTWANKATFTFVNDWTYDDVRAEFYEEDDEQLLSDPVDARIDRRQDFVFTFTGEDVEVGFRTEDDLAWTSYTPVNGQVTIPAASLANALALEIEDQVYTLVQSCGRYAAVYVNAIGGWDYLLLADHSKMTDAITRSQVSNEYDNSTDARGSRNYANDITKTISLRTEWMTDAEASRMHNLTESVNVWLQDLVSGEYIPVTIQETEHVHKTYRNEGRKLVAYELTAQIAQSYTRR